MGTQCLLQLAAHLKYFFGIGEGKLAGFRELQTPPGAPEQFNAQCFLQQADLAANGLRREIQLFASTNDAARLSHGPKITQLLVIHHGGTSTVRKFRTIQQNISAFLAAN